MINPRLQYALDFLGIPFDGDVQKVFVEYTDGLLTAKVSVYRPDDPAPSVTEVGLDKASLLLREMTGTAYSVGTDLKSLFDRSQRIVSVRFILPDGLEQIDYEDTSLNEDCNVGVSDCMRRLWVVD